MAVTLTLKKGREAATLRRHPWLFSGSVAASSGTPDGTVEARSHDGRFLARGLSSPRCPIGGCFLPFEDRPLNAALFDARVADALALRALVVPPETDGYRVIHAEGDGLPGLVVDKYGAVLVVQATTEGTEHARELWLPPLLARLEPDAVLQKNDLASRAGEGLPMSDELLHGAAVPPLAPFTERGLRLVAELAGGQKTGFFLDQRENRALVRELAGGRSVLNLFSYSGAFGVAALAGGAVRVTHVDASREALALARENHERNGQDLSRVSFVQADVFADLRARAAAGERWDVVVADPPAFAKRTSDVDRACRGYKDVNRLALSLLAPGGPLPPGSCSGPGAAALFQKVLFAAALDARVFTRLLAKRGAGPGHPVSLECPEGED